MPVTGFCILFIYDLGGFRGYGSGEICNLGFWFVTSTVWKPPWGGRALAKRICERRPFFLGVVRFWRWLLPVDLA